MDLQIKLLNQEVSKPQGLVVHTDDTVIIYKDRATCKVTTSNSISSVQFSSVQSLEHFGRRDDTGDDSAEILFQVFFFFFFLQEAVVNSSGKGRDVHSLMLSIQRFLCRPRRHPSSKMPWRMVLERLSWPVTCPNHASFRLLTVARRGSCGPTRNLMVDLKAVTRAVRWITQRYDSQATHAIIFSFQELA